MCSDSSSAKSLAFFSLSITILIVLSAIVSSFSLVRASRNSYTVTAITLAQLFNGNQNIPVLIAGIATERTFRVLHNPSMFFIVFVNMFPPFFPSRCWYTGPGKKQNVFDSAKFLQREKLSLVFLRFPRTKLCTVNRLYVRCIFNLKFFRYDSDCFVVRSNSIESWWFWRCYVRLFRLHFIMALNRWQKLYSHLRLIWGRDPFKLIGL